MGGPSKERSVSILSGKACYKALIKAGYDVIKIDPRRGRLAPTEMPCCCA